MSPTNIETIKPQLIKVAKKYNINKMYVFGSFANGSATKNSDVDLIIDVDDSNKKIQGLKYITFKLELQDSIKKNVDVLRVEQIENNINQNFVNDVNKNKELIYEKQ